MWLFSKEITIVGTMMSNCVLIFAAIKSTVGKEELSSRVFWEESEGDLVLSSYAVKTSKGKKSGLLLSAAIDGSYKR